MMLIISIIIIIFDNIDPRAFYINKTYQNIYYFYSVLQLMWYMLV